MFDSQENMDDSGSTEDLKDEICFCDGQLSCLGQKWETIPAHLTSSYGALAKRLDLSFNNIRSLQLVDQFQSLEELILDNNRITDTVDIPRFPTLHTLMLNKNKLENLEQLLDRLEYSCPALTYLSLLGNEACPDQLSNRDKDEEDYQRYRYYVLYRLPKLKFLDSSPVRDLELFEAKKRGPFLKVVRPKDDSPSQDSDQDLNQYSPLPLSLRDGHDHKGTFGKCKYMYYGRHSEGNRFIRNSDL